jgi:hypothetical protein
MGMPNRTGQRIDNYSSEYYQSVLRYIVDFDFVHRVYDLAPALYTQTESGKKWERYQGQQYVRDDTQWIVPDGWDHEHCSVCGWRIGPGDSYWENAGGIILLCDECHEFVSTDDRHGKR